MKKTIFDVLRVLLFLLMPLLIIALIIYLVFFNTTYINFVTVDGEMVDNSYNNAVANEEYEMGSNLARIDDKLYYNYVSNDPFKYGTYEISNHFTKRIYWEGISISASTLNLNVIGDGNILLNEGIGYGKVDYYDIQENEYKPFIELDSDTIKDKPHLCVFYIDGKQYWYSGDDPMGIITRYNIYTYENNKLNLYFSTDEIDKCRFSAPNFDGNYIYLEAINDDSNNCENYLYKYDVQNDKVIDKVKIDDNYGNYIIIGNDKTYSTIHSDSSKEKNSVVVTDISAKKQKEIFDTIGSTVINGYGDLVCMGVYSDSDKNGLYIIDHKTDEVKQIYNNKEVFGVYIIDNKWIYFTDADDKLYRITPDGETIEKVFG